MKRLKVSLRYALKHSGINCCNLVDYGVMLHLYYKFVLLCRQKMKFNSNAEVDHIPFDVMFCAIHVGGTSRRYRIKNLKWFFATVHKSIVIQGDINSYVMK